MQARDLNDYINQMVAVSRLFPFLAANDQLNLRATCKGIAYGLSVPTSYTTKFLFIMACAFMLNENSLEGRLHNVLDNNWKLYQQTLTSKSKKPALFYKLKNVSDQLRQRMLEVSGGENLESTGRMYTPYDYSLAKTKDEHYWEKNVIWLLAQIRIPLNLNPKRKYQ